MSNYQCPKCGNKRWFYNEVSIMAKCLIDTKEGKENGKIYSICKEHTDNEFAQIYCKKCGEVVEYA